MPVDARSDTWGAWLRSWAWWHWAVAVALLCLLVLVLWAVGALPWVGDRIEWLLGGSP